MRTLDDFPIGSTWIDRSWYRPEPLLVVGHWWKGMSTSAAAANYFVYVGLETGRRGYTLEGTRGFESYERLT